MRIKEADFWGQLKKITERDDHKEVPRESVDLAISLFQPLEKASLRSFIFSLRPAFTGSVRRAEPGNKLLFELDQQHIVQLEKSCDDEGFTLSGFAHGFDEIPVVLFGQECVFETKIEAGAFEFHELPSGRYNMAFSFEGEEYWIKDLELT